MPRTYGVTSDGTTVIDFKDMPRLNLFDNLDDGKAEHPGDMKSLFSVLKKKIGALKDGEVFSVKIVRLDKGVWDDAQRLLDK